MKVQTQIHIIDNKKLALTQDEWNMYQTVCNAYSRPNFKGEELFKNLFESDDKGLIIYIKPPGNRFTSMEVFLFICTVFQHQHIREIYNTASSIFSQMNAKMKELDAKIEEVKKLKEV